MEKTSSSDEQDLFEDNEYTSSDQEKDEDRERHELLNGEDIGEERKVEPVRKPYKGNFSTHKEEPYGCPYGICGRKFVSADQLKQHIERRHAPSIILKKPVSQDVPMKVQK